MNQERINRALARYARQVRRVDRLLDLLDHENEVYEARIETLLDTATARLDGMHDILACLGLVPAHPSERC
jgi:hypothetical protein